MTPVQHSRSSDLRSTALRVWNRSQYTLQEHLLCSTAAGAITGVFNSIAGERTTFSFAIPLTKKVSRFRVGLIPNVVVLSLLGLIGETTYQCFPKLERRKPAKAPLMQRILESKYFPVQRLPEGKFEAMLRERYASTQQEIAEIDAKIAALEASQKDGT